MTGVKVSFRTWSARSLRRGFTLTELLLVIIIIAILAAMTMTVQRSAVQSTRRERTIATIRKIDAALTSAYEQYQYRKPDVGSIIDNIENTFVESYANSGQDFYALPKDHQKLRIYSYITGRFLRQIDSDGPFSEFYDDIGESQEIDHRFAPYILRTIMLRELLLCDFPDSLEEVSNEPLMNDSQVHRAYQIQLNKAAANAPNGDILANIPDGDISADLLYLVVMNTSPETRGTFLDRETADTNNNGIPEFIDGWGNPIRFIRWAPCIPQTNRQPTLEDALSIQQCKRLRRNTTFDIYRADGEIDPSIQDELDMLEEDYGGLIERGADPFDPMGAMDGWLLTPLIYSAGPDREYGLGINTALRAPFTVGVRNDIGLGDWEGDDQGNTYSRDNITNHNLE